MIQLSARTTEEASMSIIRSSHDIGIAVPNSIEGAQDVHAWLTSMNDSGWRVLTDFRNWPNWIPEIRSVKQADSEPPARGTKLRVDSGRETASCSIDHWDPPRCLQISIHLASGEVAYGFLIETYPKKAELRISLESERNLVGDSRIAAFFFRWRQQRLGRQILANLVDRTRLAKNR